ncbi:hypothetical protein CNMCM6805_005170 [Aspergillus fumigatiaffinis]|uniref:Major facilitator superfamily transporter n=1 Tax=Aspergillus fumigatiaffinis TaxID=340414 RepID=A0A8H4GQ28_9EURO|nr:hypothetical protein CNMCM5878_005774 [Aspergillus fumigatiaffinis]KAF4218715.1 hypothetical protein CNMCM6457_003685 [Aspergillus fumigatiaffinis]KAF4226053.1 hypothetical protein CNMCM6805_005170 [Aspergillus fumigatiaffinis]
MVNQTRKRSGTHASLYTPDARHQAVDIEKQPRRTHYTHHDHRSSIESDSGDDSLTSSSASSRRPMLNSGHSARRSRAPVGYYRVPNRIMRYLCLALFSALVLFILTLFRFTIASDVKQVALELPKVAPKPPQWESFPFLKRYHGGIRTLTPRNESVPEYPSDGMEEMAMGSDNNKGQANVETRDQEALMSSLVFNPYPDYASDEYVKKYGEKRECFLDEQETIRIPQVQHYPGVPRGFPDAVMGSNTMLGIKDDVCFERFGRLGPYGFGYSVRKGGVGAGLEGHREGAERVWDDLPPVDFRHVDWAAAQNRCVALNSHRFKDLPQPRLNRFFSLPVGVPKSSSQSQEKNEASQSKADRLPRTAVVIRTWHDFQFTPDDILYLRSLISELSLLSGGEYTVHFLVHVKDGNLQIWSDDETYERVLNDALPEEFRGMGTLWSEQQMALIYPGLEETWARGLPVHGVYRSTFMPMQYFAHQHPEYDFYWNWEMDVRYTGHWYHLFDKVGSWAREQPRKLLWERNARFYVPSVHGSWEDFRHTVRVQTESGTNSPNNVWSAAAKHGSDPSSGDRSAAHRQGDKPIWGPERPDERDILEVDGEGIPQTTMEKDQNEWGVGEEADLIVFNPLYDPEGTTWLLRDDVTGYNKENGMPPRRTAIITASRLSRKLLLTMHKETSLKRHTMFSEMWPATTALHHGFKAVYVPHSVYIDRRWPTKYLESVFNAGRNGASGGARTSVFGDREHNFRGTTWFYSAGFSPNLWRRWLGYKVDNDGGEQEELAGEGRMCLPPMLLHPIKDVQMVIDDGASDMLGNS